MAQHKLRAAGIDDPKEQIHDQSVSEEKLFAALTNKLLHQIAEAGLSYCLYETDLSTPSWYPYWMKLEDKHKLSFVLVGASEGRLKTEADRLEYQLRLNRDALLKAGFTLPLRLF